MSDDDSFDAWTKEMQIKLLVKVADELAPFWDQVLVRLGPDFKGATIVDVNWQYLCLMRAAAMAIPSDGEAGMSSLSAAFSSPSELSSAPEISSPSPSPPPYPAATIQFSTIETSAATRSSIQDPGVSENREGHAIGEVASKHNSMDRLSVILEENEDLVKEKMIEEGKVEGKSANGKQTTNGKDNGTKMVEGGQKKETMKSKEQAVEEELEESEVMKEYRTDGDENAWLIDSLDDF